MVNIATNRMFGFLIKELLDGTAHSRAWTLAHHNFVYRLERQHVRALKGGSRAIHLANGRKYILRVEIGYRHMIDSTIRNEKVDNPKSRKRQAITTQNPVGKRLLECLGDNDYAWLSARTGIPATTLSNYVHGGISRADNALKIAQAFGVTTDWLLAGGARTQVPSLVSVDAADWVDVPEYDLRELTDESRGPVVSVTPFRKDWLNRALGQASNLWIARLPADLPRAGLAEGDPVFLRDAARGEAQDGAVYLVRVWGRLTVARLDALLSTSMSSIDRNLDDRRLALRDIGIEDGKAVLVARVLGAPLRRL